MTLPFILSQLPVEETAGVPPDLQGVRIMVVDDHDTSRLVLREMVTGFGCSVVAEASNGADAMRELQRLTENATPCQLLLLDFHLPDMDGYQVVEALRRRGESAAILHLTSDRRSLNRELERALGIADCLVKPIRRESLRTAVLSAMGKRECRAPRPLDEGKSAHPMNILLVEDAEDNVLLFQTYLKGTPHHLDTADNGEVAVAMFQAGEHDLVLMDMQMPVMDGYAATRLIRAWEREHGRPPCPILALTAFAMSGDLEKSLEVGCDDHLTKPIRKKRLLEVVEHYAARQRKSSQENGVKPAKGARTSLSGQSA